MQAASRARVLCVDDEPLVLEGLTLHLRRKFEVSTATSGADAIARIEKDGSPAVIISDMRMPGMDGAAFLGKARRLAPDATRILLTGQTDLISAISAVNEGQIFRFLTKPCPPAALLTAIEAGAEHHRLVTAERVLLEQTLHGSVKTLVDVLSLTNPLAFGRANRLKALVGDLAGKLSVPEQWQVEMAAMLSQLGCVQLPAETLEKVYYGHPLSEAEQKQVSQVPNVTEQLLANIPRLEGVRAVLTLVSFPYRKVDVADRELVERHAQLLKLALDFDALEAHGNTAGVAVGTLRSRGDRHSAALLDALDAVRGGVVGDEVRELPLAALRAGMVLAQDVKLTSGPLLVARGHEVTTSLLERIRHFRPGMVQEPVKVILRA